MGGYSPWGRKESGTAEHTHTHTHTKPWDSPGGLVVKTRRYSGCRVNPWFKNKILHATQLHSKDKNRKIKIITSIYQVLRLCLRVSVAHHRPIQPSRSPGSQERFKPLQKDEREPQVPVALYSSFPSTDVPSTSQLRELRLLALRKHVGKRDSVFPGGSDYKESICLPMQGTRVPSLG